MPLQFDPSTGKISFNGREVGEQTFSDGKSTVRFNIEYETSGDWQAPLSAFASALRSLPEYEPRRALLEITTSEDEVEDRLNVPGFLVEKEIKRGGYVWKFHKADPDSWPSPLHGHCYDLNLKLDVLTGLIYDASSRRQVMKLKDRRLKDIQSELHSSKDFRDPVESFIPAFRKNESAIPPE